MADEKELIVKLGLDTSEFDRELKKAPSKAEKALEKGMSSPAKNFTKNAAVQTAKYFKGMREGSISQKVPKLGKSDLGAPKAISKYWTQITEGQLWKSLAPKPSARTLGGGYVPSKNAEASAKVFENFGLTDTEKKLIKEEELQKAEELKRKQQELAAAFKEVNKEANKFEQALLKVAMKTNSLGAVQAVGHLHKAFAGLTRAARSFAKITPFANMAQHIKNAHKPLQNFLRAFKRVITYKAIRGGIGLILQGWRDGLTNLYNYSIKFGTQFHTMMDSLATDAQYVHNGLAAMAAPIINAVAPAIQALAANLVDLANAIGYFFAKILGQASFSAAIRGSKAFQELGGSAKEAKKQLMGFDELNVLTEPSGGGAGGADYGKMFEEWTTELEEGSLEQRLREAIENGDWEGVGALFAEKLNGITARFGEGQFGTTLGQKIQKGLDIARGFMFNYDFKGAGSAIATNINNAVKNINWTEVGELLARGVTAAFDFFAGLVGTLDVGEVASAIGSVVTGWFNHFTEWLNDVDWVTVGQTFFQKVKDFATNIHFGEIASSFMTFLGTAILSAFELLTGFFGQLITNVSEYFKTETEACGGNAVVGFLSGIVKGLVGIVQWVYDNVVKPFINALRGKDGLGLDDGDNLMYGAGEDVIDQFLEGMKGIVPKVWEFLSNLGKGIKETFTTWQAESKRAADMNYTPSFDPSPKLNGQFNAGFYASGGTVPTGQLFIANEAGPELVGQVNGRTTVTNQEQFTAGMADIMDNTNTVILQAAQALIGAVQSIPVPSISIGDRDIVSAYDRGKTLAGGALVE